MLDLGIGESGNTNSQLAVKQRGVAIDTDFMSDSLWKVFEQEKLAIAISNMDDAVRFVKEANKRGFSISKDLVETTYEMVGATVTCVNGMIGKVEKTNFDTNEKAK